MYTGQISAGMHAVPTNEAHPRAYGADSPTTVHPVPSMGSSPCIRGGFTGILFTKSTVGLIPVHTGQMRPAVRTGNSPPVHPRAYGADEEKDCYEIIGEGSSPCIRGRFALINPHMSPARFIPVHTGQILNFPKISETTKSLIPSQIPAVGSVCITFFECVFADNTFWSSERKKPPKTQSAHPPNS